jgi:predicted naringenin-chalcone synthase
VVSARAVVTGMGSAFPADMPQDDVWRDFFAGHFGQNRVAGRIFASSGVRRRHAVADPRIEDVSRWSTGARMERYVAEAMPLGKDAVAGALDRAGMSAADIGLFTVASCTGYATPGVDIVLARDLGMADTVQRLFVGHMGCYAALPALGAAADFVAARGRPAVVLCLELTSLHIQPPTKDLGQVVSHALFSDAAAAVVLEPGGPGLEVVDVAARTDVATADHMTWEVTDLGFRMGLSPHVPDVLAVHIGPMVADLLVRNGVGAEEVDGWAVHPGGPRILDVVAERLELPDGALDASRTVLAEHGNCSSATVLLVLDEVLRRRPPPRGRYVVALAFGPGLTLYAALLRAV